MRMKAVGRILLASWILLTAANAAFAQKGKKGGGGGDGGGSTLPPERYMIFEIESPVGGQVPWVFGLNNHDMVVGTSVVGSYRVDVPAAPSASRGFIWTPTSGSLDLTENLADGFQGWHISSGRGVNDHGVIAAVGYAPGASTFQACVLTPQVGEDGAIKYTIDALGIAVGAEWSAARIFNDHGDLVFQTRYPDGDVFELLLNNPNDEPPTLINLSEQIPGVFHVAGLNIHGEVTGSYSLNGIRRTFRYTPHSDELLHVADFIDNPYDVASGGINDHGDLAFSFNHPKGSTPGTEPHAAVFDQERQAVIDIHDPDGTRSRGHDLNNEGYVVGTLGRQTSKWENSAHAFVRVPGFMMRDIDELLSGANLPEELDAWRRYDRRRHGHRVNQAGVIVVLCQNSGDDISHFICFPAQQ